MQHHFFEDNYKKLGFFPAEAGTVDEINTDTYKPYIKIMYLPADYTLTVDFTQYSTTAPSLFFINGNQHLQLQQAGKKKGAFIYYNRDFYCIQIHDSEVACDGLLFNNLYGMPMTVLPDAEQERIESILQQIEEELQTDETSREELLRIYLKELIIKATRAWKKQQLPAGEEAQITDAEFFRNFSRLVEIHYKEKHSVADYADIMGIAPKTLTHKLKKLRLSQPNDIIKDRIMLEAKRLLIYTSMSAKEIAYTLGYYDPAYFNRLFTIKAGGPPSDFRKKYLQGKMYN